ncbi:hypothetical protein FGL86_07345 [Pistricoccus aurantiacus]|uniref:Uncharacterized protein n=1 Tax=Pistricoccus aurantiacus TaxID=1883414 RepID=A0A5B8SQF3_9GAMM|nr:hypothetical protein [Pistricoccus aurantiacus]QEA38906.1 hypothetical protein FGL86_07345 [Pistricoccus aurantiacus]
MTFLMKGFKALGFSSITHWLGIVGLTLMLTACATSRQPAEPRIVTLAVAPAAVFKPTLVMLVEQGYVIDLADPKLGRIDAQLAEGAGYRLRWDIEDAEGGSRIGVRGWSGSGPLAPYALDPLLVELSSRLGLGP